MAIVGRGAWEGAKSLKQLTPAFGFAIDTELPSDHVNPC